MALQTSLRIGRTTMHARPLRHVPDVEEVGFGEIEGIQELDLLGMFYIHRCCLSCSNVDESVCSVSSTGTHLICSACRPPPSFC